MVLMATIISNVSYFNVQKAWRNYPELQTLSRTGGTTEYSNTGECVGIPSQRL